MNTLLQTAFGFQHVEIKPLDGYDNLNYLIRTERGTFIFKTYPYDAETLAQVEAENETLRFLQQPANSRFPRPVPFADGSLVKRMDVEGQDRIARMLSFQEGEFLGSVAHSPELVESLGRWLADLDQKLQSFTNYVIRARRWEWDIQYLELNKKYLPDIEDAKDRALVHYFFRQFDEQVVPVLPELRKTTIHNDANEWNVLVKDGQVTGIIDFGDIAYAPLINELAVAMVYVSYDKEHPLDWAARLLSSYHRILPIEEPEVALLYYLVAARLCISVSNAAHARKTSAGNQYALVSETFAWKMLRQWLTINPVAAENRFRAAIDLPPVTTPSTEERIQARQRVLTPSFSLSYTQPIAMQRSAFQYMYDAYGSTYLDAYNNIPHVGHCHPKVVEAGQRQMARLNTNTRYLYDLLPAYAEKLLSYFPPSLNRVFFVNSGSAASDLAIRLAQTHTRHRSIMVMEHGYHGNTQTGIDISDYKFSNPAGPGQKEYILKAVLPDTYRGKYSGEDAGKKYAQDAIRQIREAAAPLAAFISEPIVGCGGQVPLADGYWQEMYPAIRAQGGVCISDEVQTGFGRLGTFFWGYEAQHVVPDLVVLGKPMGNGHPMGAVVTTQAIAESFDNGVEFFSSFGGNPVSCAIGLSVLEVIEEEGLQENAKVVGETYQSLLGALQREFPQIGDVRGAGLFIGVDMIRNGNPAQPDTELAQFIKNELRNRHILISTDGPFDNVLKTKPALCFTQENAREVVDQWYEVLKTRAHTS